MAVTYSLHIDWQDIERVTIGIISKDMSYLTLILLFNRYFQ